MPKHLSLSAVNSDTFATFVNQKEVPLIVIDFWAPWCAPCERLNPILEEVVDTYEGKVVIGKINIDDNPEVASKWEVRSIPTLIFFQQGEAVERLMGIPSKETLEVIINSKLRANN